MHEEVKGNVDEGCDDANDNASTLMRINLLRSAWRRLFMGLCQQDETASHMSRKIMKPIGHGGEHV